VSAEAEHGEGDESVGGGEAEGDSGDESDLLVDGLDPSVGQPCSIAARIDDRWATMLFCSFTKAGMRQRLAQPTHRSSASPASS